MSSSWTIKLTPSELETKKLKALFRHTDGRKKTVHFGAKGYSDFTKHKDVERRKRYDARHRARENWKDPFSAGALSKWILWNKVTQRESLADFKNRFRMK